MKGEGTEEGSSYVVDGLRREEGKSGIVGVGGKKGKAGIKGGYSEKKEGTHLVKDGLY